MNGGESNAAGAQDGYDVLRYRDGTHRAVPAGDGERVVAAHESETRKRGLVAAVSVGVLAVVATLVAGVRFLDGVAVPFVAGLGVGIVAGVVRYRYWSRGDSTPEVVASNASARLVGDYVDDFDPADVTDPFE